MVAPFALCLAAATNASASSDAYAIFDRARQVLQAQSYPDPIFYRTTVHVAEGSKDEFEHFRAEAFAGGDVRVAGVSDEEQTAPQQSSGVNFKLAFSIGWNTGAGGQSATATADAHRKEASPDYLGVPLISPSYSFGWNLQRSGTPEPVALRASKLPTIVTVRAIGRAYKISLVGTEIVEGFLAYHLHLEPAVDPGRYRIRELWIDAYTYQIVRLQTQGNFTVAPMADVPWLVTFQDVGGTFYIKDETALAPLVFRHDRTFSTASISFDDIRATDNASPILPTMDGNPADLREPDGR
jgi:hypothetical protein